MKYHIGDLQPKGVSWTVFIHVGLLCMKLK